MELLYPWVNGTFREGYELLEVRSPFDGSVVGTTYLCEAERVEEAIVAAHRCREEAAQLPVFKRYNALMFIAEQLSRKQDEWVRLIAREAGKPHKYALSEVRRAIEVFKAAAEECKRLPAEYLSLDHTPAGLGKEGWVKYFPIGPVAGISPFNFPLNLAVHKIAPAIAAGCPIVLKPSSLTPLSTLALARIIAAAELPRGMVNIIPAKRKAGDLLVTDPRIRLLSFTGSAEVGWDLKARAGRKRVVLELGGNAGMIVAPTAALDLAVGKALIGGFSYAGQVCIHTQRILVHVSLYHNFLNRFVEGVKSLKYGDPLDPATDISVMIDGENAKRVEQWTLEALEAGARVVCGGRRKDNYFEPTVITGARPGMKILDEEVFGPVVLVDPYEDFEGALEEINNSRYGLQAGLFTYDLREINLAFQKLEVGGLIINDSPTFRVDHMPYGGVKDSGMGREGIKYALLDMLEPKILVKEF
ncbi:MAG: aldehyde dehydrogenase family protein [Bacteroidales bacterium]